MPEIEEKEVVEKKSKPSIAYRSGAFPGAQ